MSDNIVPVVTISNIRPHSNADTLDVATVLGWQVIVGRGQFSEGDTVVYIPPDSMVPEHIAQDWHVTQYLDKSRVKSIKLRGEYSHGIVVEASTKWQVGNNVADIYGITKWEPPGRDSQHLGNADARLPRTPGFEKYTDIQNLRHFPDMFAPDELVIVTEKIHGTNSRVGFVGDKICVGSHTVERGEEDDLYWSPVGIVRPLLEYLSRWHNQVIIYGEIYGKGVQSLIYGANKHPVYRAFDLLVDGRYVSCWELTNLCHEFYVPYVPLLYYGKDVNVVAHANGMSSIDNNTLREGVVVRPFIERHDPRIGRVIMKYVSDDYLVAKKTDFADI